jgi:hypothetical protein
MATIEFGGKVTNGAGSDLEGLTIQLYTATNWEAAGAVTATDTTDSDGLWNFDAVAEQTYIVVINNEDLTKKILFDGRNEVQFTRVDIRSTLQVDTINEATSGSGVTIDGTLIKDLAISVDTINESTGAAGVTIDGVLLKDSAIAAAALPAASTSAVGGVELATTAETATGTDTARAVTPDGLHDMTTLLGAAWMLDEDDMVSDSATVVASQQSVKAYADAVAGGPSQATQSAIEAETNENTYAPPDLLRKHFGMVKAYGGTDAAGTTDLTDFNLDSVAKTATGTYLYTVTADFDDTNSVWSGGAESATGYFPDFNGPAAGTLSVKMFFHDGVATDVAQRMMGIGNQV